MPCRNDVNFKDAACLNDVNFKDAMLLMASSLDSLNLQKAPNGHIYSSRPWL